ncbi:MAG: hypothetical protein IJW45_08505, partial [Oscillospiraceae bacterium]|nr:hypothetical protein [Oscillospiraceae bacterium]
MKRTLSRMVCLLLIVSILVSYIPATTRRVHAVTQDQQNIVDRANYLYDITWVAQETIYGWRYQYTFEKGQTYRLPYAQPIYAGYYIGYGVSIEDFQAAAADGTSVFYTEMSYYNDWYSTYYGTDCSAYVSWCWGATRHTTYSIPQISTSYGYATESNIRNYLQLGDALNSNSAGHVVLVTDLSYDESGDLIQIEITEQTPPQLKRSYYTPAELAEKYAAEYDIVRYNGTVPAAPVTSYQSKCQGYAAHCKVEITQEAPIMSLPCDSTVDEDPTQLGTAAPAAVYTATKLYENTEGELWYQIDVDGEEGYILAEATRYLEQIITDVTLTGASTPNGHVRGATFYVDGTISAAFNELTSVACYIHSGFDIDGAVVTGASDTPTSNSYVLKGSDVDNDTLMGNLAVGNYTYGIYASYANYYVVDGEIVSNTGTLTLKDDYFVVIASTVSQTSCAHTNTTYQVQEGSCTVDAISVTACSTCGLVTEEVTGSQHSYGDWAVTTEPDCVQTGVEERLCGVCGHVQTQTIPAVGHDYTAVTVDATCADLAHTEHICGTCGDSYKEYTMSDWMDALPEGVDETYVQTKVQYRYADAQTITSTETTVEGYEQTGTVWVEVGTDTIQYVPSWPAGFDTTNELYAAYDNIDAKVEDHEDETEKVVVGSDVLGGYLYYHWCSASDANHYSYANKSNTHDIFHAYYSTTAPSNYKCDTSDMSYKTSDSACPNGNSAWFFVAEVYDQSFTIYEKQYIHAQWVEWSDWSDEQPETVDGRKIEERTVYSYPVGEYGDHSWNGTVCTLCGETRALDYYLFGYINGANYACEEDYENMGIYQFVDGKLVATFESDSYVAVKTTDNLVWYMAQSYVQEQTATLYDTNTGAAEKMFVPGGVEVTFTLTENEDGTLTLSYTVPCFHDSHDLS